MNAQVNSPQHQGNKWNDTMKSGTWKVAQMTLPPTTSLIGCLSRREVRSRKPTCVRTLATILWMKHTVRGKEAGADGLSGQQEFIKREQGLRGKLGWTQGSQKEGDMFGDAYWGGGEGNSMKHVWVRQVRFEIRKVGKWWRNQENETSSALSYFD